MSKRNIFVVLLLIIAAAIAVFFLYPCSGAVPEATGTPQPQGKPAQGTPQPKRAVIEPQDKSAPVTTNVPPAAHEVDTAPPVQLTGSDELPNLAKCATANFPAEAKPHVRVAVVTIRLIVDKFGNVRKDTPIAVEFPDALDEELLPRMRKLFIQAGAHAFGAKKCPPHIVNGENRGYEIEVPLHYKH